MLFNNHSSSARRLIEETDSDTETDYQQSTYTGLTSCLNKWRKAKKIDYEILELEDKLSGTIHDFHVYNDADLPFLNPRNEGSSLIRQNLIHGEVDDDCQTDDEQKEDAKGMLRNEAKTAILKYL